MKRILALALSVLLILSLSACGGKETPVEDKTPATTTEKADTAPAAGQYKDGVYKAEEEKGQYGYNAVEITVEGGKISKADLKRLNPDGTEINYDEWTGAAGADGKVLPNLKQFREDISSKIIEQQSAEGIDTISGATQSTKAWTELTTKALETAK